MRSAEIHYSPSSETSNIKPIRGVRAALISGSATAERALNDSFKDLRTPGTDVLLWKSKKFQMKSGDEVWKLWVFFLKTFIAENENRS